MEKGEIFAVLFPGQGSQKVGMGLDLALAMESSLARDLFKKADNIAKRDISKIFFYGPEEDLNQTKNTQLAIAVVSIALTEILLEELKLKNIDFKPFACCGHSLGEITALWFSGVISFENLINLVSIRSQLMQNSKKGGMAAILNLGIEEIKGLIKSENLTEKIVIANHNSPNQFVISGDKEVFEDKNINLQEKIKSLSGKAIILPVSGAFHSPLMNEASDIFKNEIDKLILLSEAKIKIPIYQNADGKPSTDISEIKNKLKKQMTSPVLWTQTINNLVKDGVKTIIEIGPGKVLTGLVKKINKDIECFNISDLKTLKEFIGIYEQRFSETGTKSKTKSH